MASKRMPQPLFAEEPHHTLRLTRPISVEE
jgi:hypothetical protein